MTTKKVNWSEVGPELLEALTRIVKAIEFVHAEADFPGELEAARKAISRASGEK